MTHKADSARLRDADRARVEKALSEVVELADYAAQLGLTMQVERQQSERMEISRIGGHRQIVNIKSGRFTLARWYPSTGTVAIGPYRETSASLEEALEKVAQFQTLPETGTRT